MLSDITFLTVLYAIRKFIPNCNNTIREVSKENFQIQYLKIANNDYNGLKTWFVFQQSDFCSLKQYDQKKLFMAIKPPYR